MNEAAAGPEPTLPRDLLPAAGPVAAGDAPSTAPGQPGDEEPGKPPQSRDTWLDFLLARAATSSEVAEAPLRRPGFGRSPVGNQQDPSVANGPRLSPPSLKGKRGTAVPGACIYLDIFAPEVRKEP